MNKKKIVCYWSPFISTVATVKAVINSALSIKLYSQNEYESLILDVFGEWDSSMNDKNYNLKFYSLNNIKRLFNFSSEGYIKSRIKYLMIFILSFSDLLRIWKLSELPSSTNTISKLSERNSDLISFKRSKIDSTSLKIGIIIVKFFIIESYDNFKSKLVVNKNNEFF